MTPRPPLLALPTVEVKLPVKEVVADSAHKSVVQPSPEAEEAAYLTASSRAATGKQKASVDIRPSDTLCFQSTLTFILVALTTKYIYRAVDEIYIAVIDNHERQHLPGSFQN